MNIDYTEIRKLDALERIEAKKKTNQEPVKIKVLSQEKVILKKKDKKKFKQQIRKERRIPKEKPKCLICGEENKVLKNKYCSKKCYGEAIAINRKFNGKSCVVCCRDLKGKQDKYCSQSCAGRGSIIANRGLKE
jgi:hypothetical protein